MTIQRRWDRDDCQLYALAVGAGVEDLHLTTDNTEGVELQALPTMGAVIGAPDAEVLVRAREGGPGGVHGEQVVELPGPLPVAGEVQVTTEVLGVEHKGSGARITVGVEARSVDGGALVVRTRSSYFVPGRPTEVPRRGGELTEPLDGVRFAAPITVATSPSQALWYRLCGDRNPLHTDPAAARRAGFDAPILHGLCSLGIVGRVLVAHGAGGDPSLVRSIGVRFAAPLVPGAPLDVEVAEHDGVVRFRASSGGVTVLDRGAMVVGPPSSS